MGKISYQGLTLFFLAISCGLTVLRASPIGGQVMIVLHVFSRLIAAGLFVPVVLALLQPEWFARTCAADSVFRCEAGSSPGYSRCTWRMASWAMYSPGGYLRPLRGRITC